MKYYDQLLKLGVFTFGDIKNIAGSTKAASYIATAYSKKGYIKKIKRNLYAAVNLETNDVSVDKYKVGSSITKDAYISYHSAFEYYGVSHQLFFEIYISSSFEFKSFQFDGAKYRYCASKTSEGVVTYPTNKNVRVTDLERTVIDCIKDLDKAGGLEEMLQCLRLITYLKSEKLIQYLKIYDTQFLYQKAGYILEQFKEELKLHDDFFNFCRSKIKKSKRYLTEKDDKKLVYNSTWQLYVPKNIMSFMEQGDGHLV